MKIDQLKRYCEHIEENYDISYAYVNETYWQLNLCDDRWSTKINAISYNTQTGEVISFGNTGEDLDYVVGVNKAYDWTKPVRVEVIGKVWHADYNV